MDRGLRGRRGLKYALVGDSSLYAKSDSNKKKKHHIAARLRADYGLSLAERVFSGCGSQEMLQYFEQLSNGFDVVGISYFGNDLNKRRICGTAAESQFRKVWEALFVNLRCKVHQRVVFFLGGYAEKYGESKFYDENMNMVKNWIREARFELYDGREEVKHWRLASDNVHWHSDDLNSIAAYWFDLLTRPAPRPAPRPPRKREREPSPCVRFVKKLKKADPKKADPRQKWLLDPVPQRGRVSPTPSSESRTIRGREWDIGRARRARLEFDKRTLNAELSKRRRQMRKAMDPMDLMDLMDFFWSPLRWPGEVRPRGRSQASS